MDFTIVEFPKCEYPQYVTKVLSKMGYSKSTNVTKLKDGAGSHSAFQQVSISAKSKGRLAMSNAL
jgi:hypothetical protein